MSTMREAVYDLAIVGAGPAGMAAAIAARAQGLSVCVLDEQSMPGGQIYRSVTNPSGLAPDVLGPDYHEGRQLADAFLACGCEYRSSAMVWHAGEGSLSFSSPHGGGAIGYRKLLVATGALERPFPVDGWTLPGVMTAGAAQILLKTSATLATDAVFCGTGPLLYLVVAQYIRAGVKVKLVLDTAARTSYLGAASKLAGAIRGWPYLRKGLGLLHEIRKSGVPVKRDVEHIEIIGAQRAEAVSWRIAGRTYREPVEHVFLHQGIAPNTNLARALGCAHQWDEEQVSWRASADLWGRSSVDGVFIAGDGARIMGARGAALAGELAALAVAADLGRLSQFSLGQKTASIKAALSREAAIRPFLDRLYRPRKQFRVPQKGSTIVCRCEEVTAAQLREAISNGAMGPNQAKAFTRCGMGPCQGRSCGLTVTELVAQMQEKSPAEAGYFKIRSPVKPVFLSHVIANGTEETGVNDVTH